MISEVCIPIVLNCIKSSLYISYHILSLQSGSFSSCDSCNPKMFSDSLAGRSLTLHCSSGVRTLLPRLETWTNKNKKNTRSISDATAPKIASDRLHKFTSSHRSHRIFLLWPWVGVCLLPQRFQKCGTATRMMNPMGLLGTPRTALKKTCLVVWC